MLEILTDRRLGAIVSNVKFQLSQSKGTINFILDLRKIPIILFKGFQVPPAEIEALLLQHPDVRDAGVIGVLDDKVGELPFAFVVKQQQSDVTEKDIIKFVAGI